MGKAGPFPRLVFREEVMLALDQFSHLHALGEHGGFLIGRKQELKSAQQYEILVERFVPIPQKSDASRLVINQEHYRSVQRALRTGERGEEIVGWAHTHPGFGVFLSTFDKEQHERFFPEPWQVAYVMDNHAHERAAYRVVDGEWNRLEGYYVLRDMAENEIGVAMDRPSPWLRMVLAVFVVFLAIAGGAYGYTLVRELFFTQKLVEQPVSDPQPPSQPIPRPEPVVTVQPVEAPPVQTTITPPSTVPLYVEYTVQRGDNLWSIANKLWGDASLFRIIAEENGLKNPSMISVGQVLRVPADPSK